MTVNERQAKTHFSKLLARVAAGEDVVILRAGKPVARLVPFQEKPARRVRSLDAGKVWISPNFDAPLPKKLLVQFYK
jgi:prevent-host-death family protein